MDKITLTIDEWMRVHTPNGHENRIPGTIKLRHTDWSPGLWFQPYFKNKRGQWYGRRDTGNDDFFLEDNGEWLEWKEPVKRITWYRAKTAWHGANPRPYLSNGWFKSKSDYFTANSNTKVHTWETTKAPENREDWGDE